MSYVLRFSGERVHVPEPADKVTVFPMDGDYPPLVYNARIRSDSVIFFNTSKAAVYKDNFRRWWQVWKKLPYTKDYQGMSYTTEFYVDDKEVFKSMRFVEARD